MRFVFPATTPALDHGIPRRLNEQAHEHLTIDMKVMSVECTTPWIQSGAGWACQAEAMVSDGTSIFDLGTPTSDDDVRGESA